jgi:hypothetical protein
LKHRHLRGGELRIIPDEGVGRDPLFQIGCNRGDDSVGSP